MEKQRYESLLEKQEASAATVASLEREKQELMVLINDTFATVEDIKVSGSGICCLAVSEISGLAVFLLCTYDFSQLLGWSVLSVFH